MERSRGESYAGDKRGIRKFTCRKNSERTPSPTVCRVKYRPPRRSDGYLHGLHSLAALRLRRRPRLARSRSIPTAVHALREVAPVQVGGAEQVHARSQRAERQGVPGRGARVRGRVRVRVRVGARFRVGVRVRVSAWVRVMLRVGVRAWGSRRRWRSRRRAMRPRRRRAGAARGRRGAGGGGRGGAGRRRHTARSP